MKYATQCDHCLHQITAYTLNLNKPLVQAFWIFAQKTIAEKRGLCKGELGLTNAQYSNFQNLRHFGVIELNREKETWTLTEIGVLFYNNQITLLSPVAHMAGKTLPDNHAAWETHHQPRQPRSIIDFEISGWDRRPEFQEQRKYAVQSNLSI